ncbi:MAG TPA: hypothetical protein VFU14_02820 [Acidimicrobiales bacterium]|nr:hypothetical protein [Acidimicrobiales bacterium]
MRRSLYLALAALGALALVPSLSGSSGATKPEHPLSPDVVTIDDATKEVWVGDAWLEVPTAGVEVAVGQPIPEGRRLVIETISVFGNGSGPVTQDQAIERAEIRAGAFQVAVPLDRYSWGSCPGYEPPENCDQYLRYWKYAGTEAVRAYVDAGEQIRAFAEHPGDGTQQLIVNVLGFLVPVG